MIFSRNFKLISFVTFFLLFFINVASAQVEPPAGTRIDYSVGVWPRGVAFDNVTNSVWVTNVKSNTVSKVDINTGTRIDYPVGLSPIGIAFDNVTNSIWVANVSSNTVSKVNIDTGARVDYPVGSFPFFGVAFDNVTNSVWVTNFFSNTVSKVNIYTGAKTYYMVGSAPIGAAFDNVTNSIWVTNSGSGTVSKVNINTGARIDYSVGTYPVGIAFDNATNSVWVANQISNTVSKVDINTGVRVDYTLGYQPIGVAFDNITNSVWVTNRLSDTVSKVNINTGTRVDYPVGPNPTGVAFDNITNSVWVANYYSNTVSKIAIGALPATPPSCTQNCYSNVLFLPGMEASRLYDSNGKLWEPAGDANAENLFLTTEGKSIRDDIYTKDVIDQAYVVGPNIYHSFINQMNDLKTAGTISDWKVAPYDWRLSLEDILSNGNVLSGGRIYYAGSLAATSSPYIIQELRRLALTSKTGKVTIVAHSNGGLVTKALTDKLGSEASSLIDKIIFVAVPQVGTPQAIGALLHGYEQGLPKDWLSVFLSPGTARTLAENMQSAYNLLPSESYFTSVFDPVATFEDKPILADFRARYGTEITSATGLKNFITDSWRLASSTLSDLTYPSVGNATLLSRAETTHATFDNWTPPTGVSLYEIAGWGEDTLARIDYTEGKKTVCNLVQQSFPFTGSYCIYTIVPAIEYTPREVIDGDGTVVVPSALWTATATTTGKWWVDLRKYNSLFGVHLGGPLATKHADIFEVPSLRNFVQNILTNSTLTTLPEFVSTSTPPTTATTRLSFLLHSPLNLSATDSLGNIISSATSTIPGARFARYGEVQVLKVPKGTPVTLNLDGYASGSFTLDMQELDGLNNIVATTTFSAVPSATSTTATISFPYGTLQTATPLTVDYDGNGITDFTLHPSLGKEVVFDTAPPEAIISFSTSTKQLLIEGIDEAGSTTVQITATSTLITDESSNTLQVIFKKLKQEKNELKLELQTLIYNHVSTSTILKTTLEYEWSTDKQGNIKELEQKATVGTMKVEAHYDAKKNVTTIEKKMKERGDEKEIKETLDGLRILNIVTDKGSVLVDY